MKKRNRVTICLAAGVLVLAVSAAAAFGSANGYAAYKDALLSLALEEENFTAKGSLSVKMDSAEVVAADLAYAQDGVNRSSRMTGHQGSTTYDQYNTTLNGVNTWFNGDSQLYYEAQVSREATTLLSYDKNDEMSSRLVNFLSIAADTVMGDLKNNFVQIGSQDGKDLYQVAISGSQVPSLVNAGLSLVAYECAGGGDAYDNVCYENDTKTRLAYYEKTTGETLSQEFKNNILNGYSDEWYLANQDQVEKFFEVSGGDMYDSYSQILDDKGGGILYVKADGSYDYFTSMKDYLAAHPEMAADNLEYYVGKDLALDQVDCTFSLDSQGRVADTQLTVTFQTVDADGGRHTMEVSGDVTLSDYGTTTVVPLDVGDRIKA